VRLEKAREGGAMKLEGLQKKRLTVSEKRRRRPCTENLCGS